MFKKLFGGKKSAAAETKQEVKESKEETKYDAEFAGDTSDDFTGDDLPGSSFKGKKLCLDDFALLKTIGKGSFGKVYQVKLKETGQIYAMKVLSKESVIARKQFEHTLAERRILEAAAHPFLVNLRFAFQSRTKLYMVLDFFNGGELYTYLTKGKFSEERARFYTAEIALGLDHMHEQGIIYRDLKPENLLLDSEGHIRITDFGLSKENVEGDTVRSICGTPEYLAPEVLRKQPYGKGVDWWSLGTLIYEMISGLPPFYDKNRQRMYKKILEAELVQPAVMSEAAFGIIKKFLNRDPLVRLGVNGFEEIKKDPFFKGLDWDRLYRKEIEPPYKPAVRSDEDTSNIDTVFTKELPFVTPTPADVVLTDPDAFQGFTYKPDNMGDAGK